MTIPHLNDDIENKVTIAWDNRPGRFLTQVTADIPDAEQPADPVVVVAQTAFSPPQCEILGGSLALPTWLVTPVVMLGSVVKGQGLFSVEYDNFTVDFL